MVKITKLVTRLDQASADARQRVMNGERVNFCIEHITGPSATNYHNPTVCRCLLGYEPVLSPKPMRSRMRFQEESLQGKFADFLRWREDKYPQGIDR